jgi:hypothetical protein
MHGICFENPLQYWFEHKVPRTTINPGFIEKAINQDDVFMVKPDAKLVWLGSTPIVTHFTKGKKGKQREMAEFKFFDKKSQFSTQVDKIYSVWLYKFLEDISPENSQRITFRKAQSDFEKTTGHDFEPFWYGKAVNTLRQSGLLVL